MSEFVDSASRSSSESELGEELSEIHAELLPSQALSPLASHSSVLLSAEPVNENAAREYLRENSWPVGLQDALLNGIKQIPIRYFICDDSGSMTTMDGMKYDTYDDQITLMDCSRWAELVESLIFHAHLAHFACAPTEFRLLNNAPPIRVGYGHNENDEAALEMFLNVLESPPYGQTPICKQISEVVQQISLIADDLRRSGQVACLVIASDGEATDGKLTKAMRPLKDLPVWVVIRLCTNDPTVLKYWNNIDAELELNMDVLDDFRGEALEVRGKNPWLTYGEPLQRIREFGVHIREIDLLDEQTCSISHIRQLCAVIFGGNVEEYEHPEIDWWKFKRRIQRLNAETPPVLSPLNANGKPKPWVKLHKLNRKGVRKGYCIIS